MPENVGSIPISLRVPHDLLQKLDAIAAATDRPRSWILLRALRQYLSDEGAEILDVKEGMAQLDNGEAKLFDEVIGDLEEAISKTEDKPIAD
jgi:predicted transcriptional regulator